MKAGWQEKKLGELLDIQNGYAFSSKDYSDDGCFVVRIGNVQNGFISLSDPKYIDIANSSPLQRFILKNGDILVSLTGNVGRVGVVEYQHLPAVLNQRVARIEVKPESPATRNFLLHVLLSDWFREQLTGAGHGAAQQNVSTKDIAEIRLHVPPLPEQQRIVTILDQAFEGIATATTNAEKNLANARELFDSTLESIFTCKGASWIEMKLEALCDIKHGFAFKSEFFSDKGDYVLLTPGNFYESGGYRDRGEKQKYYRGDIPKGYILNQGDLLVAMTEQAEGLLGSPIIVPEPNKFLHNQRLGLVTRKPNAPWGNEFFFYVFNTKTVRREIHKSGSGVKVRHTSPTKIGEVTVSFPTSLSEQHSIVAKLKSVHEETQRLEAIYQQKLAALDELKKSILHQAFSGQLH
jgi:type I restriction enzyme S subunit